MGPEADERSWLLDVKADQRLEAKRIVVFHEDDVRQAVAGICEAVATEWARGRPLPSSVKDLPLELISERCGQDQGLVLWVAGILLRSGRLPLVGALDAPDTATLSKWKDLYDWS